MTTTTMMISLSSACYHVIMKFSFGIRLAVQRDESHETNCEIMPAQVK